jgi:hypothetical protein
MEPASRLRGWSEQLSLPHGRPDVRRRRRRLREN